MSSICRPHATFWLERKWKAIELIVSSIHRFHYPCYFAPPLSVIRLGDYKLMEHILTGEQKLFNVNVDYLEQNDLIGWRKIWLALKRTARSVA